MTTTISYRKKEDAWLSGRDPVYKAEDPIPYFEIKPSSPDRRFMSFEEVFPRVVSGPTTLNDLPNATEDEGENTDVRRGDRSKDWLNGTGGLQRHGGKEPADSVELPSAEGQDEWVKGDFSADSGWLYKDTGESAPPPASLVMQFAPVTEAPPALDGAHAGDPAPWSTGDWLGVSKHGSHDQSTHGHDEGSGDGPNMPGQSRSVLAPSSTLDTADRDDRHVFVTSPEGLEGPAPQPTKSGHRPLYQVGEDIARVWGQQKGGVNYAARPYLEAMADLEDIKDTYGADSAKSIVAYFLSNASSFRGPDAQRLKGELRALLNKSAGARSLTFSV